MGFSGLIRRTQPNGDRNMGRPERALERDGSPARELAFWLRDLRNRSGLTYDQLARLTRFSTSTLQEALSGRRLATLQVTLAVVEACQGDIEAWRSYWAQLRRATDPDVPAGARLSVAPPWLTAAAPADEQAGHASGESRVTRTRLLSVVSLYLPRRYLTLLSIGVAVATVAAIATVLSLHTPRAVRHSSVRGRSAHQPGQSPGLSTEDNGRTYTEEEYNRNGEATFRFLNASGPGQPLEFREFVQISCRIYAPTLPSTRPDGYWYRIASFPWDNNYYAVANTFLNGDPPSGPYTHNVDQRVPKCRSTRPR